MRIRMPDGTVIETSSITPSKRSVKNKGGSLKRWNASRSGGYVGGYRDDAKAIYAASDKELCVVVEAGRKYTLDVGGSCSTGYIGGRGV